MKKDTKIYITLFGYLIVFIYLWLSAHYNEISNLLIIDGKEDFTEVGIGYNNTLRHATIYLIMYILFLSEFQSNLKIQYLVRMDRKEFFCLKIKEVIITSLLFSSCLVMTQVIIVSFFIMFNNIEHYGFFSHQFMYLIMSSIWYCMIGAIYLILTILFSKKQFAYIGIFIFGVLHIFLAMNYPKIPICLSDFFYLNNFKSDEGLNIIAFTFSMLKNMALIILFFSIGYNLFNKKDILKNENS